MMVDDIGQMLAKLQARLDLAKRDNGDHMKLVVEWVGGWAATVTIHRSRGVHYVGPSFKVGLWGHGMYPFFIRRRGAALEVATAAVDTALLYFESCTRIEPYMVEVSINDTIGSYSGVSNKEAK